MTNSLWRKRQEPEALKLALEALEMYCEHGAILKPIETRDAIKETLAQPEHDLYTDADKDKPNAICDRNGQVALAMCKTCGKAEIELDEPCVKPPQRTWVGLTPQERDEINEQVYGAVPHHVAFHHAIEAKLKEKNT